MKKILIASLFVLSILTISALQLNPDGSLRVNGIDFDLNLEFNYRTNLSFCQTLQFVKTAEVLADSVVIRYENAALDVRVSFVPQWNYLAKSWLMKVRADYKQNFLVRDLVLNMVYLTEQSPLFLRGPQAIYSGNASDNTNLYPFTEKFLEVKSGASSFWIVGSGYRGTEGAECIYNNSIRLYDHTVHFAALHSLTDVYERVIDTMPRQSGDTDWWSVLLFEEKPYLLRINRWPGVKQAALAISNDADGETYAKLKAVYFGSSNPASPDYLTKGLIANNIKVSNTVFGINKYYLGEVWHSIRNAGSSIGYHTYSGFADSTHATSHNLLNEMTEYNIRLWIDHDWSANPEDFNMYGGMADSPFYILDIINQSGVDYAWCGSTPPTNPFNVFTEPWRLPHKLHFFGALTRPVWFFGRTRMEAWEYIHDLYTVDFKHNMTPENLDRLIAEGGLCIAYTHFGFIPKVSRLSFYEVISNGEHVIRPEFNDVLVMLDDYQNNRGLWIETVENIFDRMFAIEGIRVVGVEETSTPGLVRMTLVNASELDVEDVSISYGSYRFSIPFFAANSTESLLLNGNNIPEPDEILLPFLAKFANGSINIRSREYMVIPPVKVSIYNIKGQLVRTHQTDREESSLSIPFTGKSSGVYFARIQAEGYRTQTAKFFVVK